MQELIIVEANDEGVQKMAKLDLSSKENFVKDLKKFFTNDGEFNEDYIIETDDEDEEYISYNINSATDDESLSFFKDRIYKSFVDGDSYSIYQIFNENCQECNFPEFS